MKAVCKVCGKEFERLKENHYCCSDRCRQMAENERRRNVRMAAKGKFVCRVCGKEFQPSHGLQTCCSPDCRQKYKVEYKRRSRKEQYAKIKAANPAERIVRKCELCGKEFTVGRMKQQRFCSTICNKRAYRIKHGAVPRRSRTDASTVFERAELRRQKLMQEVIDAQRGPIEELYEKSKKWTKKQRDFAKARYLKIHFGK